MISEFFINRPVLANVLAIVIVLIGGVALLAVFAGPVLKEGFGAVIGTWVVVGEPGPRLSRLACYHCWRYSLWH